MFTNLTIDLSNSSAYLANSDMFPGMNLPAECYLKANQYSAKCLNSWFCPQMPSYMVNLGIGLIIAYIVASWALWALNQPWCYDKIDDWLIQYRGAYEFIGDMTEFETRVYWIDFFKSRFITAFLIYLGITVWLYWGFLK